MDNLNLEFIFNNPDKLTMYGDYVSGIRDLEDTHKLIATEEGLDLPIYDFHNNNISFEHGMTARFLLKQEVELLEDIYIEFDVHFSNLESVVLMETLEGDKLVLTPKGIMFSGEEELFFPYQVAVDNGHFIVKLIRESGVLWVELSAQNNDLIHSEKTVYEKPLTIGSVLVGEIMANLSVEKIVVANFVEDVVIIDNEEKPEEPKDEPTEDPKPKENPVIFGNRKPMDYLFDFAKPELHNPDVINKNHNMFRAGIEDVIIQGYEGLFAAASETEVGNLYRTPSELKQAVESGKTTLVKLIYFVLSAQPTYASKTQPELKLRAFELFDKFGKSRSNSNRKYGFEEGVVYKSFSYGELTDKDLNNSILIDLLIEEYEGVKSLIKRK